MAIIKNPLVIAGKGKNEGYNVESIDNGDGTQTLVITEGDDFVSSMNIQNYKLQDLSKAIVSGGAVATDEEYANAEEYLQGVYSLILNGGSNE